MIADSASVIIDGRCSCCGGYVWYDCACSPILLHQSLRWRCIHAENGFGCRFLVKRPGTRCGAHIQRFRAEQGRLVKRWGARWPEIGDAMCELALVAEACSRGWPDVCDPR